MLERKEVMKELSEAIKEYEESIGKTEKSLDSIEQAVKKKRNALLIQKVKLKHYKRLYRIVKGKYGG